MNSRIIKCWAGLACTCVALGISAQAGRGQDFRYESKPRVDYSGLSYASPDPAPRMMRPSEEFATRQARADRGYLYSRYDTSTPTRTARYSSPSSAYGGSRRSVRDDSYSHGHEVESIPPGEPVGPFAEEAPFEGEMEGMPDGEPLGDEPCALCGRSGSCGACGECGGFFSCFCACLKKTYLFSPAMWQNFNEFGGAQAFKGPVDLGVNGNFGFHKGVNWATPLWDRFGIGSQLGGAIVLSDFEGNSGPLRANRDQYFVTAGLFRRAECNWGLQGGAVFDYLHDSFYVNMNLMQVRAELSWVFDCHELGFWGAFHTNSDTKTPPVRLELNNVTWQSTDQYNLFYRRRFCNGGVGRMWVGVTAQSNVIFGSDATAPLSERWAIQAAYNYLMPTSSGNVPRNVAEGWNVVVSLVWYPGYKVPNACFNPYRPLFTVADNGTFMERVK